MQFRNIRIYLTTLLLIPYSSLYAQDTDSITLEKGILLYGEIGEKYLEEYMELSWNLENTARFSLYENELYFDDLNTGNYMPFELMLDSVYFDALPEEVINFEVSIYKEGLLVKTYKMDSLQSSVFDFKENKRIVTTTSGQGGVVREINCKQEWVVYSNERKLGLYVETAEKFRHVEYAILRKAIIVPSAIAQVVIVEK